MAVNLPHLQLLPSDALHADTGSDMTLARQLMLLQFQTEINDKIPPSVQEACLHEWRTKQCVTVVCANLYGTFYVNSAGEFHIRMHANEEVVSPNKFEELAGKKTARNWQQSIRLAGGWAQKTQMWFDHLPACLPVMVSWIACMLFALFVCCHVKYSPLHPACPRRPRAVPSLDEVR